jgi:hypothetical protein
MQAQLTPQGATKHLRHLAPPALGTSQGGAHNVPPGERAAGRPRSMVSPFPSRSIIYYPAWLSTVHARLSRSRHACTARGQALLADARGEALLAHACQNCYNELDDCGTSSRPCMQALRLW